MRNWLRDPRIVGVLGVVAVLALSYRIYSIFWPAGAAPQRMGVTDTPAEETPPEEDAAPLLAPSRAETGRLGWVTWARRNPFTFDAAPAAAVVQQAEAATTRPVAAMALTAIMIGPDQRMAMIGGTLVSPGARLNGYHVVDIQSGHVLMETKGQRSKITFDEPMQTAAISTPAGAKE